METVVRRRPNGVLMMPAARILVIVGRGHAPILRELIEYDPELRLVEAREYLPPP